MEIYEQYSALRFRQLKYEIKYKNSSFMGKIMRNLCIKKQRIRLLIYSKKQAKFRDEGRMQKMYHIYDRCQAQNTRIVNILQDQEVDNVKRQEFWSVNMIVPLNRNIQHIFIFAMTSKPSDDQLRQAIDAIFNKYDSDKSGTLEGKQIFCLINDAFKSLGRNREVKNDEVSQFVKAIDKNGDGKISKAELFDILKKLPCIHKYSNNVGADIHMQELDDRHLV